MQAIRVHEGEVLAYETVADPEPPPREVLVELRAAGLNRVLREQIKDILLERTLRKHVRRTERVVRRRTRAAQRGAE